MRTLIELGGARYASEDRRLRPPDLMRIAIAQIHVISIIAVSAIILHS